MVQSLSRIPAQIERFRMAPWPFQQTFQTPLKDLQRFVDAFSGQMPLEKCALNTDEVVFEPKHLLEFLSRFSITVENQWKFILSADSSEEGASLLVATLSDWVDFCLVPESGKFAIYADHDEYITFYAEEETTIGTIRSSLVQAGYKANGYIRPCL
jgi:hypothetical protein